MVVIPNSLSTCLAPSRKGTQVIPHRYQPQTGNNECSLPGSANGAKSASGMKHEGYE